MQFEGTRTTSSDKPEQIEDRTSPSTGQMQKVMGNQFVIQPATKVRRGEKVQFDRQNLFAIVSDMFLSVEHEPEGVFRFLDQVLLSLQGEAKRLRTILTQRSD